MKGWVMSLRRSLSSRAMRSTLTPKMQRSRQKMTSWQSSQRKPSILAMRTRWNPASLILTEPLQSFERTL